MNNHMEPQFWFHVSCAIFAGRDEISDREGRRYLPLGSETKNLIDGALAFGVDYIKSIQNQQEYAIYRLYGYGIFHEMGYLGQQGSYVPCYKVKLENE